MKKMLLFVSCLSAGALSAAVFHVSPSGSNKNQGTEAAPFGSIAFAASKAKPGDVVKIGPGLYREQITFTKSGKKNAPITFVGSRGKNGEFLSIVEAPGRVITDWKPAPEIGENIWKTSLSKRPDLMMMDGKMILFINRQTMALPRWKKLPKEIQTDMFWSKFGPTCQRLPGLDILSTPKDIKANHRYLGDRRELFWETVGNVGSGWTNGVLYLRFANEDTPEKHKITATYGEGFILKNVSHLVFKDLHLRGSRTQFSLKGKSSDNVIDSCLMMHGGMRVRIDDDVQNTTVRNSILTAGFIRGDLFGHRSPQDMRGGLLYEIFKYMIGVSLSDDVGIFHQGKNVIITNNIFMRGLLGIRAYSSGMFVKGNVIRNMSSVGISTGAAATGIFTENIIMNCGIPLRIHDLRGKRAKREEYHFRNLYVQGRHSGSQIYIHCESHRWGPDVVNFEKDKRGVLVYKKNPPAPVDPGKIHIYHNTFWGGSDLSSGFSARIISTRFREPLPFFFANNVMKGSPRMETKSQYLFNGNLLYTFDQKMREMDQRDPEIARRNRLIDLKETANLWNSGNVAGLPDMTLKAGSPALECGIDLSKTFAANGREFKAFPGLAPGYFKGKAPAAGAFQMGESQEKFFLMYKKSEKIFQMLNASTK